MAEIIVKGKMSRNGSGCLGTGQKMSQGGGLMKTFKCEKNIGPPLFSKKFLGPPYFDEKVSGLPPKKKQNKTKQNKICHGNKNVVHIVDLKMQYS